MHTSFFNCHNCHLSHSAFENLLFYKALECLLKFTVHADGIAVDAEVPAHLYRV